MAQTLVILTDAGLTASIKPDGKTLSVTPAKHITPNVCQFIIKHKAEILAELKATNDGREFGTSHSEPLAWLAARGIYLEATGIGLQNISTQANSIFPDNEAAAYISAHVSEILHALVAIKFAELAITS